MKSVYIVSFAFLLSLFASCEKDDLHSDPNYPTTVTSISSEAIDQLLTELESTPLSCTSVDTFGHCYVTLSDRYCLDADSNYTDFSKAEITSMFYETLLNYGGFIPIGDTSGIRVASIKNLSGVDFDTFDKSNPDSAAQGWIVTSNLQRLNGYSIPGTEIKVLIYFDKVRAIEGKRYDDLYLPPIDVYSEELAKQLLADKEFASGSKKLTIDEETYWYKTEKIIFPITISNRIELRVCWALHPDDWLVVVDSQTGETLTSIPL